MKQAKTTYDTLPERIDYLISEMEEIKGILAGRTEKPEEIPKYLDIDQALTYMKKTGFSISKSKLYKLTSSGEIPFHKADNRVYFFPHELDTWMFSSMERNNRNEKQNIIQTIIKNRK